MASLYELTDQYRDLAELVDDDDIDYEEFCEAIAQLEDDIESKVANYCKLIRNLQGEADVLKAEADRLTARKRSREHAVQQLKDALGVALDAQGKAKIKTPEFTVSFRTSTRLEITDVAKVPQEYFKPRTEDDVRKADIKKQLVDTGEVLPWCRLVEGRSLSIR